MSWLVREARHTIRLNEGFSKPQVRADGVIADIWYEPFDRDSNDWVEIRDECSPFMRRDIQTAATTMAYRADSGAQFTGWQYTREYIELFKHSITDWSLTENSKPLARTEETYRQLGAVGDWLAMAIDAHYAAGQLTPEQRKNYERERAITTSTPLPVPQNSSTSSSQNGSASTPIPIDSQVIEPSPSPF